MKFGIVVFLITCVSAKVYSQPKPEAPFSKDIVEKADKSLEIRRISAQLDGAFLMDRRAQIGPLLEELKKLAPDSAVYLYFKGLEAYTQNRKLLALSFLRKATAIDPAFSPAQNLTGLLLLDANRPLEAQPFFSSAVDKSPHDPVYLYNLAMCEVSLEHRDLAIGYLTRALEAKANFAEAAFWKGSLLLRTGQRQAAFPLLSSSIEFGITDPRAYQEFFKLAEELGREARILEVLDLMADVRDAPRLRIAADVSMRYAEWEKVDWFFTRLLGLPEAAREDRKRYVDALFASNRNPANWIRSLRIEESERSELLSYLRDMSSSGPLYPARDPVARPGR